MRQTRCSPATSTNIVDELERLGRAPKYVLGLRRQMEVLVRECGWARTRDVTAESFRKWRSAEKRKTPKTLNEYLCNAGAFMGWLEKGERLARNPLRSVQRIEKRGESTHPRRALTHDEAQRLISLPSPFAIIYWLALETGLRRGEVEQLEWRDVRFDTTQPFLLARSSTTKNRKDAHMPLSARFAAALLTARPGSFDPRGLVFAEGLPRMARMRRDLEAAGSNHSTAKVATQTFTRCAIRSALVWRSRTLLCRSL